MKACGADLGEIVIFDQHHREADLLETLSMREGKEGELLRVLREGVKLHGIRLVIIDTLTAFTPARVDGHEAVAVRQMMKPLARFASDCGVGVLVICHARKRSSHDSTHGVQATVLGSVDYVAACRSALLVQRDPKAEEGTAGVMTHAKCNFGPPGPSLSFSIGADGWKWGEERQESADEIEEALLARTGTQEDQGPGGVAGGQESPGHEAQHRRENRDLPGRRTRGKEILDPGTEREPSRSKYDTITGVLNGMREEGRSDPAQEGQDRRCCGAWPVRGGSRSEEKDEDKNLPKPLPVLKPLPKNQKKTGSG